MHCCSGHGAMKENHFLDDGAYSAVQIIIETVRRRLAGEGDIAAELLKDLKEAKDASEFRLKITVSFCCMQYTAWNSIQCRHVTLCTATEAGSSRAHVGSTLIQPSCSSLSRQ